VIFFAFEWISSQGHAFTTNRLTFPRYCCYIPFNPLINILPFFFFSFRLNPMKYPSLFVLPKLFLVSLFIWRKSCNWIPRRIRSASIIILSLNRVIFFLVIVICSDDSFRRCLQGWLFEFIQSMIQNIIILDFLRFQSFLNWMFSWFLRWIINWIKGYLSRTLYWLLSDSLRDCLSLLIIMLFFFFLDFFILNFFLFLIYNNLIHIPICITLLPI